MRLAVDRRLERRLDRRDALLVRRASGCRGSTRTRSASSSTGASRSRCAGLEPRQLLVALVDRLDLEGLLVARVVEVALLVELGDEAVGLGRGTRRARGSSQARSSRSLGYGVVHELTIKTERRTQLLDITSQVRDAVAGASGAAVLVYVPHTTAGLTINEHADPAVARDFEAALERIVAEGWGWQHIEEGEENAPSHIRAALMGPQVVIPLRDGELGARHLAGHLLLRARRAAHALRLVTVCVVASSGQLRQPACAATFQAWRRPFSETRSSSSRSTRSPSAGTASARLDGFVVFVRARPAGRHGARARDEGAAPARRGDRHRRPRRPGRERVVAPCAHFPACGGCRFQDLAYDVAARGEAAVGRATRCSGWPGLADAPLEPIVPARRAVRLPQQARVLVHADRGRPGARLPPGRPLGRGARDRAAAA